MSKDWKMSWPPEEKRKCNFAFRGRDEQFMVISYGEDKVRKGNPKQGIDRDM